MGLGDRGVPALIKISGFMGMPQKGCVLHKQLQTPRPKRPSPPLLLLLYRLNDGSKKFCMPQSFDARVCTAFDKGLIKRKSERDQEVLVEIDYSKLNRVQ